MGKKYIAKRPEALKASPWQNALGDCIVTCIWVAASSLFAEIAEHLTGLTGLDELALNIALLVLGLAMLAPVAGFFWGAMFNPIFPVAMVVRGKGSLAGNLLRMAGQLVGVVMGTAIAMAVVPQQHQGKFHMLSGSLRDGVSMELGFACEAGLAFLLILLFLYTDDLQQSEKSMVMKLAPHLSTMAVVVIGAELTGPSLNPYQSFAWNYVYTHKQHSLEEHVTVFWFGPLLGTVLAALLWRLRAAPAGPAAAGAARGGKAAASQGNAAEPRSSRDQAAGKAAARAILGERMKTS